jgi:CO dehydrogenase maturation factor
VSKHLDKIPSGVTKDRFIEMRVQEALSEEDGFDMLVMGRPEGPGCYCYVNNLLRAIVGRITKGYDFVVTDNAAGMEHISRRTMRTIDRLVLVSDYSVFGVRSARRIYDLAKELDIKIGDAFLVVNKIDGPVKPLEKEIDASGLKLAGVISYDERVSALSISGKPVFELKDPAMKSGIEEIFDKIVM